jgi:hypothetical protein
MGALRGVFVAGAILAFAGAAIAQELWHFGKPNTVYGVYRKIRDPQNERNWNELRVGHIDTFIKDVTFDGKPAKHYSSTAIFAPKINEPPQQRIRKYETWLDPATGRVLRVKGTYSAWRTEIEADAVFKKDEVEVTVRDQKGVRTSTFYPAEGVESFVNPFTKLMAEMDKDRKEVTFNTYDITNAGIRKYTARVIGKWKAEISNNKYSGATIEVNGADGKLIFYVSTEGEVFEIDLPDGAKIYAQVFSAWPGGALKLDIPPAP